ncbi:MAG: DUF192 domain-containing protein [Patescibacteria group bacterium]
MNRGFLLVLFVLLFLGIFAWSLKGETIRAEWRYVVSQAQGRNTEVTINEHKYDAEVARTNVQRSRGLAGRSVLRKDTGMLFVFDESDAHGFWMKDTLVSLDIIWINDGVIVDIMKNAQPAMADNPPIYYPSQPANYVLELSGGSAIKDGIAIGQSVIIKNLDKFTD